MKNRMLWGETKVITRIIGISLLCLGSGLLTAGPRDAKVSADLGKLPTESVVDVIIQFREKPGNAELSLIQTKGGKLKRNFKHISAGNFTVPVQALPAISALPNVSYVSPDRRITGKLEFANPAIGAEIAYNYDWKGAGVGVAVLDSGISTSHPDLKPRVVYSENFVDGEDRTDDPYGHGTHVSVVLAGNGYASSGWNSIRTFRGIAPEAKLINLRVLNANGEGTDSSVIQAIDRAIELKNFLGIRVLNLSLGRAIFESYTVDPLCKAVERAWQAGIVVVVAAGNNGRDNSMGTLGYGTIASPGNSPYAITVGALKDVGTEMRGDDVMASFSSKGPTLLDQIVKPDIVAPGNSIVGGLAPNSVIKTRYPQNVVPISYYKNSSTSNISSTYFRLSGTSMATPMVAGAAALLIQKNPALTPDQVKARLMRTATKNFPSTSIATDPVTNATYQITYDLFTVGAGYLDVWAALQNNEIATGPALSPKAVYDPASGTTSVALPPGSVWNNAIMWGTAIIWGNNVVLNGNAIIWGTAIVWGTEANQGFAIIWGTDSEWGSGQPFSEQLSARGEN